MNSYNYGKFKIFDKKLIKSILIGVLCAIVVTVILTLLASFIFLICGNYPTDAANYLSLAFLGAGGFSGGYIAARLNKASGLAVGALTGFIIFIIILIAGLSQSLGTITLFTLYKLLVIIIPAVIGGILGVNKQNKIKI